MLRIGNRMVRNRAIGVIVLVLLMVTEGSDVSLFSEIRKMMAAEPEVNGTKISPSPAPILGTKTEKNLDLNNNTSTEKPEKNLDLNNNTSTKKPEKNLDSNNNTSTEKPKKNLDSNNNTSTEKPEKNLDLNNNTSTEKPEKNLDLSNTSTDNPEKEKVPDVEQKGSNGTIPEITKNEAQINKDLNQEVINEKCEPSANKCTFQEKMTACLKQSNNGSPNFTILIQNEGESVLNVSVIVSASVEVSLKELQIREHHARKINASINTRESHKIILNSSYGECLLYTGVPVSEGNLFQRIPYANQVTPIYGAYFMFLVALIVGGTWGCCKLRKKGQRGNGGVPYQELEMALPESATAVNVDAENGWDQGWDDDWDEDRTVKSPGNHVGNLSANGLTSRSPNREGWENDWDD